MTEEKRNESCGTCRHSYQGDRNDERMIKGITRCRRYPPVYNHNSACPFDPFPLCLLTDWCGEYVRSRPGEQQ